MKKPLKQHEETTVLCAFVANAIPEENKNDLALASKIMRVAMGCFFFGREIGEHKGLSKAIKCINANKDREAAKKDIRRSAELLEGMIEEYAKGTHWSLRKEEAPGESTSHLQEHEEIMREVGQ
jgi:hypothetical protein